MRVTLRRLGGYVYWIDTTTTVHWILISRISFAILLFSSDSFI